MTGISSSAAWPARVFTGATVLWAATLPLATLAAGDGGGWLDGMAALVYAVGHVLCHQRPERSFAWLGQSWPVCARCTGIYIGAALGVLLVRVGQQRTPDAPAVRLWLAAAALPTVITIGYEWTTGQMPAHGVRSAAGSLLGLMAARLIVIFLREWRSAPVPPGPTADHEVN